MPPTLDLAQIYPVTEFVRNYKAHLSRLRETGRPEVLTVNGVAECVLVDTKTYQEMNDAWERERFVQAVNEGIEQMNSGTGKSSRESFQEIRAVLGQ
jgi:PHD/YefM family antitoxin component YafN of YafNO toxin-antitoxin module